MEKLLINVIVQNDSVPTYITITNLDEEAPKKENRNFQDLVNECMTKVDDFCQKARKSFDDLNIGNKLPKFFANDNIEDDAKTKNKVDMPIPNMPNPNLRFGAGFEIDEPRREDYLSRYDFESDHAAFDRFVDAGEECVARGLEKKSDAPITKCNAIRTRVGELPPMGVDLIGETHWWDEPFSW